MKKKFNRRSFIKKPFQVLESADSTAEETEITILNRRIFLSTSITGFFVSLFYNPAAKATAFFNTGAFWKRTASSKIYVEDVFSAYTYTGTGGTRTITNGIDLSTKGGLVWTKSRSSAIHHGFYDTARGANKSLFSNLTSAQLTYTDALTAFTTNGFTLGADATVSNVNQSGATYVSWTFRKAPKFFDVVTYTGTGVAKTVAHALGVAPGMIIVKRTDTSGDSWAVYHQSLGATKWLYLNTTDDVDTAGVFWNNTEPTSSQFSVGTGGDVNASGGSYIAYLFAHDSSTSGLIQCGTYTGSGSLDTVTLGWEPQFVLMKNTNSTGQWSIEDVARKMSHSGQEQLQPNSTAVAAAQNKYVVPTATGFTVEPSYYGTGANVVYMAIRRGLMKKPTLGTQVYNAIARTGTGATATITGVGFPPDLGIIQVRNNAWGTRFVDRLRYKVNDAYTAGIEQDSTNIISSWNMDGVTVETDSAMNGSGATIINHFFRRAPGFLDIISYTATNSGANRNHNLGVAPELIIDKRRDSSASQADWYVYHSALGETHRLALNSSDAKVANSFFSAVTSTTYASETTVASTRVAYLFASLNGVSKVGTYTGNGTTQTIACGFTTGARFILIKRTDSTGDWLVWDSVRNIISGNDPHLGLNSTAVEVTDNDSVDPDNSGFIVNQVAATNINVNSATYIFLAIS